MREIIVEELPYKPEKGYRVIEKGHVPIVLFSKKQLYFYYPELEKSKAVVREKFNKQK